MFFKKNDDGKIKQMEAQLSSLYDEYIECYRGTKDTLVAYHERYINAIKKGFPLIDFLNDEIAFVRQLIQQNRQLEEKSEEKSSILSEITLKRQESIAPYPEISYFDEMDYELRKFFGVMKQLYETDFPEIEKILKYRHGRTLDEQLDKIQSELLAFIPKSNSSIPGALVRYKIFYSGNAYSTDTEREKNIILQRGTSILKGISQFLHMEMRKNQTVSLAERKILINKENYVEQILDDFRIRDIASAMSF